MPYFNSSSIFIGLGVPSLYTPNWYCKFKQLEFALRFLNVLKKTLDMPFYAVAVGRVPGVYKTW